MFLLSSVHSFVSGSIWLSKFLVSSVFVKPVTVERDLKPHLNLQWIANDPLLFSAEKAKHFANVDVIVIGSGPSGMVTAAYFAKQNKKVLVLEQHHRIGGGLHSFEHGGYIFDGDLHINTSDRMYMKVMDYITEGRVNWYKADDDYFRYSSPTTECEWNWDYRVFRQRLLEKFPNDAAAINEFFNTCKYCARMFKLLALYYAVPKCLPWLKWLIWYMIPARYKHLTRISITEYLASLTSNTDLIDILASQYVYFGRSPSESIMSTYGACMYSLTHFPVAMPEGGARAVPFAVVPTIRKSGGEVFGKAHVDKILIKNGWFGKYAYGVMVQDVAGVSTEIHAPLVISSAGIYNTYGHMVPEDMRLDVTKIKPSTSVVCAYVGFDDKAEALGVPKKVGLNKFPAKTSKSVEIEVRGQARTLQFTRECMFFSAISAHDPSRDTDAHMELVAFQDYDMYDGIGPDHVVYGGSLIPKKVRSPKDEYNLFKEIVTEELLNDLYVLYPQLEGHVKFVELGTPLTCQFYLNSPHGAAYSADRNPRDTPYAPLSVDTGIRGFYCTGQDTFVDGVACSSLSGLLTITTITGRNVLAEFAAK